MSVILDRCARPRLGPWRWGSYRVMGTVGYLAGLALVTVLGELLDLRMSERLVIAIAPIATLFVAVKVSEILFGYERIVFYEQTLAVLGVCAALFWVTGGRVAVGLDLVTLGVGTFLACGRIGCFMVACCHGRPARWGVRYSDEHGAAGFTRRWVGRPIVPLQLVDSALTASMVTAGVIVLLGPHGPGQAAALYLGGYAVGRFLLELFRGDAARPYWSGLSEAQWTSLAIGWALVILYRADLPRLVVAVGLTVGAGALVIAWRWFLFARYWLTCPWHVEELQRLIEDPRVARGEPAVSSLGVRLSVRELPGGGVRDFLLSHPTRPLTRAGVRAVARQLALDGEVRPGATTGLVHLLVRDERPGVQAHLDSHARGVNGGG